MPSLPLCEAPLCKTEKTILSSVACREVIIHMKVALCQIWSRHGSVTSPRPFLHLCELRSTQKDALFISLFEAKLWSSIYPAIVLGERPRLPYGLVVQLYLLRRVCSANLTLFIHPVVFLFFCVCRLLGVGRTLILVSCHSCKNIHPVFPASPKESPINAPQRLTPSQR